jgi:ribosomal protein S18 acetylase RimI-like enzyme
METYPVEKPLKDGTRITLREMVAEDEDKLLEFFRSLPMEERQYLKMDVTQRENVRGRMNLAPYQKAWRLVAEQDGKIWGDGSLVGPASGWMSHTAEIRCIVHKDFQRKGLGSLLLKELFQKTLTEKYEVVFCDVMAEQTAAIAVLEKLGFVRSVVRPKYVKDINGDRHDLIIFTLDVKGMWNRLKAHFGSFDLGYGVY